MIGYESLSDESLSRLRETYVSALEAHREGEVTYPCGVHPTKVKRWLRGVKSEQKRREDEQWKT